MCWNEQSRLILSWYNYLINQNKAVELNMYPQDYVSWLSSNSFTVCSEEQNGSARAAYVYKDDPTEVYGVDPTTGSRNTTKNARMGHVVITGTPGSSDMYRPRHYTGVWIHEVFGHTLEYTARDKFNQDEKAGNVIREVDTVTSWIKQNNLKNKIDGSDRANQNIYLFGGPSEEGFATYFELIAAKNGIYERSINPAGLTVDENVVDYFGAIAGINVFSRIAARWVCVPATLDVTCARPFYWSTEFWSNMQVFSWINGFERLVNNLQQQLYYAGGMIDSIDTVKKIKEQLTAQGKTFSDSKYLYWKASQANGMIGDELERTALSITDYFAETP